MNLIRWRSERRRDLFMRHTYTIRWIGRTADNVAPAATFYVEREPGKGKGWYGMRIKAAWPGQTDITHRLGPTKTSAEMRAALESLQSLLDAPAYRYSPAAEALMRTIQKIRTKRARRAP